MTEKRKINGQAFINDIRSGMSDTELMLKYKLSSRMLQSLFRTLLKHQGHNSGGDLRAHTLRGDHN